MSMIYVIGFTMTCSELKIKYVALIVRITQKNAATLRSIGKYRLQCILMMLKYLKYVKTDIHYLSSLQNAYCGV